MQSRVQIASRVLGTAGDNYLTAAGRIQDADIADESSSLVRRQIVQQSAAAVLASANQQPALALKLLSGG